MRILHDGLGIGRGGTWKHRSMRPMTSLAHGAGFSKMWPSRPGALVLGAQRPWAMKISRSGVKSHVSWIVGKTGWYGSGHAMYNLSMNSHKPEGEHTHEQTLLAYFESLASMFQRAGLSGFTKVVRLQIADCVIELHIAGKRLETLMLPALAHLEQPDDRHAPDIVFYLEDGAETGARPPRPPFTLAEYRRYGQRAVAYRGSVSLMHAPVAGLLYACDKASRQGCFWCRDAAELSIYEQAAPVQTLFHWALRAYGWQVVHAAAVGTEAGGVLLVGNTGAGKSTTALALLEQNNGRTSALRYLSDDKCLVRLAPDAEAFALFNSAKLKVDMLERFPTFRSLIQGRDDTYKAGKTLAFLHPTYAERMIRRFPVRALITPRIAHLRQPRLTPARGPEVFRALGPSTVIWLPGAEGDNFHFTANLVRTLPCYRLDLAVDPARNSALIGDLLAGQPAVKYPG